MQKTKLMILALLLLGMWSCKNDNEPEVTTGQVIGAISDANSKTALEGVRIIVFESNSNTPVMSHISGPDGSYKIDLHAGSYYVRLYRNGYNQLPPKGMSPLPFTVTIGSELSKSYEMNPSLVQNGGIVKGRVSEGAVAMAGVLVVAEKEGMAYSAVTDAAGDYFIYNLPAGSYSLKGWMAAYTSDEHSIAVAASAETTQHLQLSRGTDGAVSGSISFLASNATEVDIALVHPKTGEVIPGLITKSSQNYLIENVPAGTYIARASFQNDDRVVDPDWIIKNGEPTVTVSNGNVVRNFSLTGSVKLTTPTNPAETTEPFIITTTTPEFSWAAYSSSSDYVVEVSDVNGNVIWGGFSEGASGLIKNIVVPSSRTSVVFNNDGAATSPLIPGRIYRWRVYASKDDSKEATGWKLISVSEDQRGIIKIAE